MKIYLKYVVAGLVLAVASIVYAMFSPKVSIGFLGSIYYLIAVPFFIGTGAYLGHLVRDYTQPDFIMTSGLGDTFKQKVFWKMGPQLIGAFLGLMATDGLHKTMFGPPVIQVSDARLEHAEIAYEAQPFSVAEPANTFVEAQTPVEPAAIAPAVVDTAAADAAAAAAPDAWAAAADAAESAAATAEAQRPTLAPSFDCTAAASPVEHMICKSDGLADLDNRMASKYKEMTRDFGVVPKLIASQREWISQRNACADAKCVEGAYDDRLTVLANVRVYGSGDVEGL